MKINWSVRAKSPAFWTGIVGAAAIVAQAVLPQFGVNFDVKGLGVQLDTIITGVFGVLALFGVVVDPTTKGVGDSDLVMARTGKAKAVADSQHEPNKTDNAVVAAQVDVPDEPQQVTTPVEAVKAQPAASTAAQQPTTAPASVKEA